MPISVPRTILWAVDWKEKEYPLEDTEMASGKISEELEISSLVISALSVSELNAWKDFGGNDDDDDDDDDDIQAMYEILAVAALPHIAVKLIKRV